MMNLIVLINEGFNDEVEHDISENVQNKTLKEVINRWWMDTLNAQHYYGGTDD